MPTSMSSLSVSTGANRTAVASCSTAYWSRLLPSSLSHTNSWSNALLLIRISETTRYCGHLRYVNTHHSLYAAQIHAIVPQCPPCSRSYTASLFRKSEAPAPFLNELPSEGPVARNTANRGCDCTLRYHSN